MTREERITTMENQKVLNGRVFDPDILTKFGISNLFDALATKCGDVKNAGLPKRFLKGKYQLLFEFINKLDELEEINLSAIMLECECVEGKTRGRSQVTDVLEQQAALKREVTDLTEILNNKILNNKEIEIASLRSELQKAVSRGPGTSDENEQVLQKLRDENERLLKTNASPSEEVKALNMQLIKAHEDANERLSLFMCIPNPFPHPS
ncbi:hypothetical protein KY285_026325 [Solanum tuberosum]|nr:hypothetical protein KY285_026325 [Solanum tuberosum]